MFYWYEQLYMAKKYKRKSHRILRKIEKKTVFKKNYTLITLARNSDDLFDIIGVRQLFFRYYKESDMYVLGVAPDEDTALVMLEQIIGDLVRKQGIHISFRQYFAPDKFHKLKDKHRK